MINVKKIFATALAAALCACAFTGCDDKNTSVSETKPSETLPPGKEIVVSVGEDNQLGDISVNYKQVIEPRKANTGTQFVLIEVVVENKGSKTFNLDPYKNFKCKIDGENSKSKDYLTAKATKACADYAKEKNSDTAFINGEIKAGESLNGYYPLELANGWKTVELQFVPNYETTNDAVVIKITPDMVTAAS